MAVKLISPRRFGDERGWFAETYSEATFAKFGIHETFRQDNHSMSAEIGVLRGLHFQRPPSAQAKLVRCVRGRILMSRSMFAVVHRLLENGLEQN